MNQEKPWKTLENQSKLGNLDVVQTLAQALGIAGPHKIIQNNTKYTSVPLPPRVSFTSGIVPTTGR